MRRPELEAWDRGRLLVHGDFTSILRNHELTSFEALMDQKLGTPVKATLRHRMTACIELDDSQGTRRFYIKRHEPAPLREYVKPLIRLRWPIMGARNEWEAMFKFHELGIPTMIPVAFGRDCRRSFVMTQAIENCTKLSDWMETDLEKPDGDARRQARWIVHRLARIVRTMHRARMHHQDLYLGHLLLPNDPESQDIFVIDLGRVDGHLPWSRHWIIKDLAQLEFSSDRFTRTDRVRFLQDYLGRALTKFDRVLIWLVLRKSRSIRHHARSRNRSK